MNSEYDDMLVGSGPIILGAQVDPKVKSAIEVICAEALAEMGRMHDKTEPNSMERTFVEICAATLQRTLSPATLDKIELRIKERLAEKA